MKGLIKELLCKKLKANNRNYISFYSGKTRKKVTYRRLSEDVDEFTGRLNFLKQHERLSVAGILGPVSYEWLVADLACIKSAVKSVALLETFPVDQLGSVIEELNITLLLVDFALKDKVSSLTGMVRICFIGSSSPAENHLLSLSTLSLAEDRIDLLEEYSVGFSSGTSEKTKQIRYKFAEIEAVGWKLKLRFGLRRLLATLLRKKNKIILFMPFSHFQQRYFAHTALLRKMDIVISDPVNCFRHVVLEKPNIMISVPIIYETMARGIEKKISGFNDWEKRLFHQYNRLGINAFSDNNLIKIFFSRILLRNIKKIYGGKAEFFVTGSAPIDRRVLEIFYSVGVKIYQAYGQSESSTISVSNRRNFRIGSVGRPGVPIRISAESEILIPFDEKEHGHNRSVLDLDDEGYIHTGDLGYLDKDGYLFITGRKDEVIVLKSGEKVFPGAWEFKMMNMSNVNRAVLFSPNQEDLNLIINISNIKIGKDMVSAVRHYISSLNSDLGKTGRVAGFHLSTEPFSMENGLLTANLKSKRKAIINRYKNEDFLPVD